jgi:tetratricopeptide (TPR) repeat protein
MALAACGSTTNFAPRMADGGDRSTGSLYGDFLVATYAGNTRDSRVAAARYLAALQADPTNPTLLERAFIFSIAAGDMDQAVKLSPRVMAANPESDLAHLIQGVYALKMNDYAAAKTAFTAAHPAGDPDLMARLNLAWTAVGAGDAATARALVNPKGAPGADVFLAYHRARLEEALGDAAAADASYAAADKATGGKSLTVALAYATWLQATNRAPDAEKILQNFLDTAPGNPVGISAITRLRNGKPIARRIETAQQGAAEGFYGLASAVGDEEAADAAIVYLRLAQYLDPSHDGALAYLGGAMERAKRTDEAIALYRDVPETSPFYVTAEVSAADLLDDSGRTEEAIKILRHLERDPATSALAASALGDVYREAKDWPAAVEAYSRAIERTGPNFAADDWPLFYARGIANERARRWDAAEADFKQALALKPEQPLVMNYLAYSWIEHGTHIEEALKMLQRAVDLRPDDGYIIDSLGWAYYRLGQYDKAVEVLESAIQFSPYEATLNEHLGDAYWKIGRKREAQFLWRHAIKLKPEEDRIPILQAKMKSGLEAGEALEGRQASAP